METTTDSASQPKKASTRLGCTFYFYLPHQIVFAKNDVRADNFRSIYFSDPIKIDALGGGCYAPETASDQSFF
jgi:hypothetical protein